jgi:hypothetical protein
VTITTAAASPSLYNPHHHQDAPFRCKLVSSENRADELRDANFGSGINALQYVPIEHVTYMSLLAACLLAVVCKLFN